MRARLELIAGLLLIIAGLALCTLTFLVIDRR